MTFLADRVTNIPVPFRQLRMKDAEGLMQEGVVGATDLKIVQRAAGADQTADFSVGAGWVRIDSGTRSGLVHFYNDAVANIAATAANGTNPRVDIAVVRYNDSSIPAGTGGNTPTPEILVGTATAGAQVITPGAAGYRAGAPALPNDCLLLADILRPTATNAITAANIVDRRSWARGAFNRIVRNSNAAAGSDYLISATTVALVDATNLQPRIECSGVPVRVRAQGRILAAATNHHSIFSVFVDATGPDGTGTTSSIWKANWATSAETGLAFEHIFVPAAGSHLIGLAAAVDVAITDTLRANATTPLIFTVEELIRQNANNT